MHERCKWLTFPLKRKLLWLVPSATSLKQLELECALKCNVICGWTQLHNLNYPEESTKQEIHDVTLSNTGLIG